MKNNPFNGVGNEDILAKVNSLVLPENDLTYRNILALLDLTSLNITDTDKTILSLCEKVNNFTYLFPDLPDVAAICVFPRFVPLVRKNLSSETIKIASVGASFPTSQTFTSIKADECKKAVENGADEIDMVVSVGDLLAGNIDFVSSEIRSVKEAIGKAHLKVILETGVLEEPSLIYQGSMLAMEAGADFIKTSTGKTPVSATPEAAWVMCSAIADYHKKSGVKVGFKPAGGVATTKESTLYFAIVNTLLGNEWTVAEHFRIGASRLANSLLSSIEGREILYF